VVRRLFRALSAIAAGAARAPQCPAPRRLPYPLDGTLASADAHQPTGNETQAAEARPPGNDRPARRNACILGRRGGEAARWLH